MTYRDLAIAAMDNHRLAHQMMANSCNDSQWEYWAGVQMQAQRELHSYLNWMMNNPKRPIYDVLKTRLEAVFYNGSEDLRPAISEGLQSHCA